MIIHSRERGEGTHLDIMKAEHNGATGECDPLLFPTDGDGEEYLNMGYYLGIGGSH